MALQEVLTRFGFDFDGQRLAVAQRGVKRAERNLNTIAHHTDAFRQHVGGMLQRSGQLIGTYLGYRVVRVLTTDYAAAADAIAKFSAGLGISAQKYQRLTHAARLNGVTIEELNVALPKLAKSAGDAADGSKALADAFRRAGIQFQNGEALGDPIDLLTAFADGLKGVKDPIRRTQVLMNAFGRAGKKMGVLMAQGSEGIEKAMAEADKFGLVLSDKQLKAGEKFTDEMLRVKAVLTGIRNTIAGKLLPALTRQLHAFRTWWVEGENAERAMRALKLVAMFTGVVIARMITASVIHQVKLFVRGIWAGVQALRAMGLAAGMTAIKVWAIFAAFVLVALAIEDLIGFAQGKDSVIGRLLGDTSLAKELKTSLLDIWKSLKKAWKDLKPALLEAWKALKPALKDLWKAIKPLIGPAFRGAVWLLIAAIDILTTVISAATNGAKMLSSALNTADVAATGWYNSIDSALNDADVAVTEWVKSIDSALNDADVAVTGWAKSIGESIEGAWVSALDKVKKGLDAILNTAKRAYYAMAAVLGFKDVGGLNSKNLDRIADMASKVALQVGAGPTATQTPFGTLARAPVHALPGSTLAIPAVGGQTVNTQVANGAIQLTVYASGDAKKIAKEVNTQVNAGINAVFTNASRDLVKPPRGQR